MKEIYNNHKIIIKNIIFTVIPATIFQLIDKTSIFNEPSKFVFTLIAIIFIIWQVSKISLQEEREAKKLKRRIINI